MTIRSRALRVTAAAWLELSTESKGALVVLALGVMFLVGHLPFLAPGPGSIDSTNFALAVRRFDVAEHRPHPPGYPVFVALGKIAAPLVAPERRDADSVQYEARALAIWSTLFGAFAVFPLFQIFRCLDVDTRRAAAATALTVTCPIFWFTAIRPVSDIPGLGTALISQALVFSALRKQPQGRLVAAERLLLAAAVVAGLALGLRLQTASLTVPVLALGVASQAWSVPRRGFRCLAALVAAFVACVALWAVPMFAATGGPRSYFSMLGRQAEEDFSEVDLLVGNPTLGRLATGLVSTVAHPWADRYLAPLILALGLIGAITMLRRSRRALGWLAIATGPYAMFHLLYQDPVFTRYALPVVPAVAFLAVQGVHVLVSKRLPWVVAGLAVASLAVAASPVLLYAATGSPAYQAITAVRTAPSTHGRQSIVATHHEVGLAIRGERIARQLPFPRRHEWLELVEHWRKGGSAPVWFLADHRRTDLVLIDPAAQTRIGSFRFPFNNRFLMSGAQPAGIDWYEVRDPGWMVGEGWALTPETAGVAWRDDRGPAQRPITAWIRRRPESAFMIIGGRNLGQCGQPDVRFDVMLASRRLDSWVVGANPGSFLRTISLPAGSLAGPGRYAELSISAASADGVIRSVDAAIEQFDVQSTDRPMYGFDRGWYQMEHDRTELRLWRWAGPWATLQIHHGGRDRTIRLAGDSPAKYGSAAPVVTVRAGATVLGRFTPVGDYTYQVRVPAAALDSAAGTLTLEANRSFVPDDALHNGDRRPLGFRLYEVKVH